MRIHEYALMKDVTATLLRPRQPDSMWKAPPLVVMNNFAGRPELKLATALFQNLFPAINVQTAKLSTCQARQKSRHQNHLLDCQTASANHCMHTHALRLSGTLAYIIELNAAMTDAPLQSVLTWWLHACRGWCC